MNEKIVELVGDGVVRDAHADRAPTSAESTDENSFAKNRLALPDNPFTDPEIADARSIWGEQS